ncbi:formate dehydrogenase accessory protein FdhE, partial [Candidatus Bathyarchaeota archaeon]|nr:formate dehydrogenase accessory protein FdhE [Candidatus Bathyarchaeota archaeon]
INWPGSIFKRVNCLARSDVKKQILELDSACRDFPRHLSSLELQRAVLEILIPLYESPKRGARKSLSDEDLNTLVEKAASSKLPISEFLEASFFDESILLTFASRIADYLRYKHPEGERLNGVLKALKSGEIDAREAVKAVIEEDAGWFMELSDRLYTEAPLLLFLFEAPLRPFYEELARRLEGRFRESWWEPICPICGRRPTVARIRGGKRYVVCAYCGVEYLIDLFLCVNCGNRDPYTLGFIVFDDLPEYELDYCEKCNHYIKVIHESRLKKRIPGGLEDLLTNELDALAREIGLERV